MLDESRDILDTYLLLEKNLELATVSTRIIYYYKLISVSVPKVNSSIDSFESRKTKIEEINKLKMEPFFSLQRSKTDLGLPPIKTPSPK